MMKLMALYRDFAKPPKLMTLHHATLTDVLLNEPCKQQVAALFIPTLSDIRKSNDFLKDPQIIINYY
jgi:hypothetical protein